MTNEQIIEMAKQAGLPEAWISETGILKWSDLESFAKLVAEHEREACAKLCECYGPYPTRLHFAANLIRARGQRTPEGGEA
jgi:hypothetical protein